MVWLEIIELDDRDDDLYFLENFLRIIDSELIKIIIKIRDSDDPTSDGSCCFGEYLIGYGFISIQRYFTAICALTDLQKNNLLKTGPKIIDDIFLADLLYAGANYAKHQVEWQTIEYPDEINYICDNDAKKYKDLKHVQIDRHGSKLKNIEKNTYDIITKITPYAEYTLSNLLAEILNKTTDSKDVLFLPLLPLIKKWSGNLDSKITKTLVR